MDDVVNSGTSIPTPCTLTIYLTIYLCMRDP